MRVLHERASLPRLRAGLPAPLRTPAGWWQRPRRQLEQQSPSPCRTRCSPWPWSLPLPPHLPAWRPAQPSRSAQGAGCRLRDAGGAPGALVCAAHLDPLCSRLGARGLGRSSPQPISNWLTEVGGMHGRTGSRLPLWATVSEEEDWDREHRRRPGWEQAAPHAPRPRLQPRGGAWCRWDLLLLQRRLPTPGLSSVRLLGSPPCHLWSPRQCCQSISDRTLHPGQAGKGRQWEQGCSQALGLLDQRS